LSMGKVALDINSSIELKPFDSEAARKQLIEVIERVHDGFVALDNNWVYTVVNTRAAKMLQREKPEDLIGKHIWTEFPEGVGQPFHMAYEKAMETQEPFIFEEYFQPWDLWFENRIYPSPNGLTIYFTDITIRKKAEEALRLMAGVFDSSPDGIFISNLDRQIVHVNRAYSGITGYTEDEVKGTIPDILQKNKSNELYEEITASLASNGSWQGEILNKRKNGEIYPAWLSIGTIKNENGEPASYAGVFSDISERKHLQKQLQQAQKMEAIGQLTGGIAHDFNNILSSILGFAELSRDISEEQNDPDLYNYLSEVVQAGQRASDLIKQMLAFSRGTALSPTAMKLDTVVEEVTRLLKSTFPSSVQINLDLDDVPEVKIDPVNLHQIVMNLCINARDSMIGKGKIQIKIRQTEIISRECSSCHNRFSGFFTELSVSDNGSGINPEQIERIFEPFFTTKEVGKGTGMGLSMVHGILHDNNGHILVESGAEGTTFRLLFPPAEKKEIQEKPVPNPFSVIADWAKKGNILVVDDDPSIALYLSELLKLSGYTVSKETNSLKALEHFTSKPESFDLLITDLTMPDMNGKELTEKILAVKKEFPIILCTGFSEELTEENSGKFGVSRLLFKPIRPEVLLPIVNELLQQKFHLSK